MRKTQDDDFPPELIDNTSGEVEQMDENGETSNATASKVVPPSTASAASSSHKVFAKALPASEVCDSSSQSISLKDSATRGMPSKTAEVAKKATKKAQGKRAEGGRAESEKGHEGSSTTSVRKNSSANQGPERKPEKKVIDCMFHTRILTANVSQYVLYRGACPKVIHAV